jgi:hypothetical protein
MSCFSYAEITKRGVDEPAKTSHIDIKVAHQSSMSDTLMKPKLFEILGGYDASHEILTTDPFPYSYGVSFAEKPLPLGQFCWGGGWFDDEDLPDWREKRMEWLKDLEVIVKKNGDPKLVRIPAIDPRGTLCKL